MPWMMARTASGLRLGLFVGEGEEHVDVGVGEEIFAAVAAQGQQGDVLRGLAGKGAAPHFNEDTVDHGGAAADGGRAVAGALTGLADERHLPRILLPKIVNRQSDWIHECCVWLAEARKELLTDKRHVQNASFDSVTGGRDGWPVIAQTGVFLQNVAL
jgi:hypothetical protein